MKLSLTKKIYLSIASLIILAVCMVQINGGDHIRLITCTSNLKQIGLALKMYAEANNTYFPNKPGRQGFEMLRAGGYLENVKMYTCPGEDDCIPDGTDLSTASVSYMYVPGLKMTDPPTTAIARDKEFRHASYLIYNIQIRFTDIGIRRVNLFPIRHGNVLYLDGSAIETRNHEWAEIISKNNFTY
ncbi:MAG: hypothetical protein A2X48_00515 [Lentisphaerae bacterium GWF2_49_21]|nr:MAG: hypothetical protein A2X48_00515 [Lentisphaerae bacterium GWF2_49_21]